MDLIESDGVTVEPSERKRFGLPTLPRIGTAENGGLDLLPVAASTRRMLCWKR